MRRIASIFILNFSIIICFAQHVPVEKAEQKARNHYFTHAGTFEKVKYDDIVFHEEFVITHNTDTLYYVFNLVDDRGFVIISADERVFPILGYSFSGNYSPADQPPSFTAWMEKVEDEIMLVKKEETPAREDIRQKWKSLDNKVLPDKETITSVGPLVESKWNQGCGFNAYCPEDPGGPCGHAQVGCVAVAQAQIMKYWGFPETGRGSNSYEHSNYDTISVDFGEAVYDWENMPNESSSLEVAKLLYHVGVSVNMSYGPNESSAFSRNVRNALVDNFRYSFLTEHLYPSDYDNEELIDILVQQLNSELPVYYSGCPDNPTSTNPCHAFVVDGYQSLQGFHLFHFNFGWGGSHNGFFYPEDLSGGGSSYNNPSDMVINIMPGECEVFELPFKEDFESNTKSCWQSQGYGTGISEWALSNEKNRTPGGNSSAFHHYGWDFAEQDEDGHFISPAIKVPEETDTIPELSFWSMNYCPELYNNGKNSVLISTDGGESYTEIWVADSIKHSWTKTNLSLEDYAGEIINIIFRYQRFDGPNAHTWYIDDIKVDLAQGFPPTVSTMSVFNISENSATCIGNISEEGDAPVTQSGFVWSKSQNPTLEENEGLTEESGLTGTIEHQVSGLTPETIYYIRAYAINDFGTSYGNVLSFKAEETEFICGESTITDVDGNEYNTVKIGEQCWMQENLRTTRYRNGTMLDNPNCVVNFINNGWSSASSGAYIWNHNNYGNKYVYGAMYNWYAVDSDNELCPPGWHVPTENEWRILEENIGLTFSEASSIGWRGNRASKLAGDTALWKSGTLTNDTLFGKSGFDALPGGWYPMAVFTDDIGEQSAWWTSTNSSLHGGPYYRRLYYDSTEIKSSVQVRSAGMYVRCIQNLPRVRTGNLSHVFADSAKAGGDVRDDGGAEITNRGHVWGTKEKPDIYNYDGITEEGNETGRFTSQLTGLLPATTYFIRAYVTNEEGTTYGEQVQFKTLHEVIPCPGLETVEDVEGNVYSTVLIGDQCWMAENLNVTQNPEGEAVTRYCMDDNVSVCDDYGGLYTWTTTMDGETENNEHESQIQGICPTGWHIPGDEEWKQLEDFLIANGYNYDATMEGNKIAKSLAAQTNWRTSGTPLGSIGNDLSANNGSGFSALPGRSRLENGSYLQFNQANFWSSTLNEADSAWSRHLHYRSSEVSRKAVEIETAFSVRCVTSPLIELPDVSTLPVSYIFEDKAYSGVEISDEGGAAIEVSGVVWSTDEGPSVDDYEGISKYDNGTGRFTSEIKNLKPTTTYYLKAYATNAGGTAYGEQIEFTTHNPVEPCSEAETVTDYEGNVYGTVMIGDQCWMAENLNVTTDPEGNPLTRVCIDNDDSNCNIYGGLYSWETAMNGDAENDDEMVQGICPPGWYVPSDEDWKQLSSYLIANNYNYDASTDGNKIAAALASKDYWSDSGVHPKGSVGYDLSKNNSSGFNALPGGALNNNETWLEAGENASFWSSTSRNTNDVWHRQLYEEDAYLIRYSACKESAFSVRCIKKSTVGYVNESLEQESFFKIYPNPTNDIFTVEFLQDATYSNKILIEIRNMMGVVIHSAKLSGDDIHQFDLSGEPQGIYNIFIKTDDNAEVKQLIKTGVSR